MQQLKHKLQSALTMGMLGSLAKFAAPACTIVRYHSVRPEHRWQDLIPPSISHTPDQFEQQIQWLTRHYHVIGLDDLRNRLTPERELDRGLAVITFDDGFVDNYQFAAPILERHGIRGAFFVTVEPVNAGEAPWFSRTYRAFELTEADIWRSPDDHRFQLSDPAQRTAARHCINRLCASQQYSAQTALVEALEESLRVDTSGPERSMMNWQEIAELHRRGHTIGSHTLSHPNLTTLSDQVLEHELSGSKAALEHHLESTVEHLSYPNPIGQPHWDRRVMEVARSCGYLTAGTSTSGYVRKGSDALAMFRLAAPNSSFGQFKWHLQFRPRHKAHSSEEES